MSAVLGHILSSMGTEHASLTGGGLENQGEYYAGSR